jgi:hypothetical protein
MFNFSVPINGIVFTQDDFDGLQYLDGIPDSLEAMADELSSEGSLPWPVSSTSFDPQFHAITTLTISNNPARPLTVGDFVIVNKSVANYMGAVVTAVSPTTVTVEWVHTSEYPSAGSGPWTIIKTRARLRDKAMRVVGWGGLGSHAVSNSALLKSSRSRTIEVSSGYLDLRAATEQLNNVTFLAGGWSLYSDVVYPYTYTHSHITPTVCGGVRLSANHNYPASLEYGSRLGSLAPFAYGACVFELVCTALGGDENPDGAFCGLINGVEQVKATPTSVVVSLQSVKATYTKPDPDLPVVVVFSPHTKVLEVWQGNTKLGSVVVPNTAIRLTPVIAYPPGQLPKMYARFNYSQQVWR